MNESEAFFIWVHILEDLKYYRMFDRTMSKLRSHMKVLEEHLKSAYPEIYDKVINEVGLEDLSPIFCSIVSTVFVVDLQHDSPEIAAHIFDVFLVDGESVVYTLITKFISLKEVKMLELDEEDFITYFKRSLPRECFCENSLQLLLDCDLAIQRKF